MTETTGDVDAVSAIEEQPIARSAEVDRGKLERERRPDEPIPIVRTLDRPFCWRADVDRQNRASFAFDLECLGDEAEHFGTGPCSWTPPVIHVKNICVPEK